MSRSNKTGQSDRSKNGRRLEDDVRRMLNELVEKSPKLDNAFRIAEKKECKIRLRYPGATKDKIWLPDFMIIHEASGAVVVIGGAKASLRERYPVDALPWDYCRRAYTGGLLYFQATSREHDTDTLEQIREYSQEQRMLYGDLLPLFFSTKDPDSEIKAAAVITKYLNQILKLGLADLDRFPKSCYEEKHNKSISRNKSKLDEEQPILLFK